MSTIWQLPRDILHSIYSEWLRWKDLSILDIACVKKSEREEWLTSIADLKKSTVLKSVPDNKMIVFYKWLTDHKVLFVEEFPVRLGVLQDLSVAGVLDMESFCPALHSIFIDRWSSTENIPDHLENDLSVFLSHCHNLQEVTANVFENIRYPKQLCGIILSALVEKLRENSLVKISLHGDFAHHESHVMITNLLKKHASSLQDLIISKTDVVDLIMSTLIENHIHLRTLIISLGVNCSQQMTPSLLSYLSSAGDLLEVFEASCPIGRTFDMDKLVVSVATYCPKVTRFVIHYSRPCSIKNLIGLYEQCPHLQSVTISGMMVIDDKYKSVSIEVKGSNDDWAICLSHALSRRQYKQVILSLREKNYHPVGNLKSMLEPYQISVSTSTRSETSLISLLQDLPHLNTLLLNPSFKNQFTDATLLAITAHTKSLTELYANSDYSDQNYFCFSDCLLAELIKACPLLKKLTVCCCGLESLVAVSELSSLTLVYLTMGKNVSQEMLDGLLLDEKVQWPSTLKEGSIELYGDIMRYKFNQKSRHWTNV